MDALRACAQDLEMSTSSRFAATLGNMEEYLYVITGSYRSIYGLTFEAASAR